MFEGFKMLLTNYLEIKHFKRRPPTFIEYQTTYEIKKHDLCFLIKILRKNKYVRTTKITESIA